MQRSGKLASPNSPSADGSVPRYLYRFRVQSLLRDSYHLIISYICYMKLSKRQIETISNYFKARPVLKAYLFGSYVRGDADNQSDIDILVDLDYSQKIGLQFVQMKIDLEKLLNANVDLVSSQGLSEYVRPLVDSEKQLIYAR